MHRAGKDAESIVIMPAVDFIPTTDVTRIVWFNNFAAKFAQYAAQLGFAPADVQAANTDAATFAYLVNAAEAYKTATQERVAYKRMLIEGVDGLTMLIAPLAPVVAPPAIIAAPGIVPRTRALVKRIKASPVYSSSMGVDMGIIASGEPVPDIIKPVIAVAASVGVGVATVRFAKGRFDGISLEWKRGAESDFVVIGFALVSPLVHDFASATGGVAEVLQYRARFIKGNAAVGEFSSIVSVLVG